MASSASKILLPYQQRWVNDRSVLKIWLAARQIGKSFAISMEAVAEALEHKCNNLILSASQRQSREVMEKVYSHLRYLKVRSSEIIAAERETKEEVALPIGSRIISLPASPDTVRGFSGNVFLDEFAFHHDSLDIWRAMYPMVTRGHKVRITSTPNGKKNMFYQIWDRDNTFSKHRTDIYQAKADGLDVDIPALKAGIGDPDAWAQEFECQFIDEATAYITYEMIAAVEDDDATKEPWDWLAPRQAEAEPELYLGVDIGRKKDLTVLWLAEKVGDVLWTRGVKELLKAPFRVQREILFSYLGGGGLRGHSVRRACLDASGIGMQLAEEASETFGSRAEAVAFTLPVKEDLAVTLRRRFEDRLLRIPKDQEIREDLHSVRKVTTAAGNVRYDAEATDKGHADRFWALALAAHAASTPAGPVEYQSVRPREAKFQGMGAW
jgi:phage FluMu gp28-like protein